MSVAETKILWLPNSSHESRAVFDYESNSFLGGSNRSPAGVRVDANTALNSTVVLACVRVLAEGLATLPLHIYARGEGGGKEVARAHPLYRVLHDTPNEWQTSFEWREMQMLHLGIYGQSFNEIIRDPYSNIIKSLTPLHPSRMLVERIETGRLRYTYTEEDGRVTPYSQDEIMHIRWMSNDGVNGMVPIELARDAIGLARACEIHGASFFANGARPGMVLSTDNTLSIEAAEKLRVNWERVHRGPDRASATAVLTGGLKPVEFGNTNQESQFLETRRFQIEEICRLYRVPGSLVGDLSRSNFANIEQQSIDFVQHTLLPWLRRFESAFSRDLLVDDDKHFAEFDTRGLMRGDAAARASYYSTLWNLGVASVNELRAWENLNPVEGGDARFAPLNMQTLENASKQQTQPTAPSASVNELVAVLSQVAAGTVAADAAKGIMAAAFPSLPESLAGQILAGVAAPAAKAADGSDARPAADVGGLVTVLASVKDGSLQPDAAVAALGSVYPTLPETTARQIVAGVNQPPADKPAPAQPSADVAGLLAILGQVGQGAVTPEAALSIVQAVFPAMSADMARAIIGGVKAQQQPQAEAAPPAKEPAPASRAFCPGASPPDNSCSPANKGDGEAGFGAGTSLTEADRQSQKISQITTADGRAIPEITREMTTADYLEEIERDAKDKGFAVTIDKAADLQTDANQVEDLWAPYDLFTSNSWKYFTDSPDKGAQTASAIDDRGTEYGTISDDQLEGIAEASLEDQWKEIVGDKDTREELLRAELGDEYLAQFGLNPESNTYGDLSSALRGELYSKWRGENWDAAVESAFESQAEARDIAVSQMRKELERSLAGTEIDCCIQLYRGMDFSGPEGEQIVQKMISEGVVRHTATNSWTTGKSVAGGFGATSLKGTAVLLVCRNPSVGYVRSSDRAGEKEVTRPPSEMRISAVVYTDQGVVLHVEEDGRYDPKPVRDTLVLGRRTAEPEADNVA